MYRHRYTEGKKHDINELKEIIHVLRDPDEGCAWDSVQTHESLKKNLIDECGEVITAIDNGDSENLCEELGDIMLQILLHAEIASEEKSFCFDDVIQVLADKLIRRHPHIFGDEKRPSDPAEAEALWRKVKKIEKQRKYSFYGHENCSKVKAISSEYPGIETPLDLYGALLDIWCEDTCAPRMRGEWSPENRTLGQCSITAFLAQDIFGGEVYGVLTENNNIHCYNVAGGIAFDLTSEQFKEKASLLAYDETSPQDRESPGHFGKEEKRKRYGYLKEKLKERTGG